MQERHIVSRYFAPRGESRMYTLGMQLGQLYLSPFDKLIGFIGEAGSGKSALIRGMFPGLELTNDDNGVYIRPLPLLEQGMGFSMFAPHTYHIDIRFENGFTQMTELAEAIIEALKKGKRVVVEHFDLIYPLLGAKNTVLTPHVAFATDESMLRRAEIVFDNLEAWLSGAPKNVCKL